MGRSLPFFKMGDAATIFNDLLVEFQNADLSIVNLECPLIVERTPLLKNGPVLGVESDCINGLKKAGIDMVNLANNHILDHGSAGLMNTLKICQEAGLKTVGAGDNLKSASRVVVCEVKGVRIGVYGVAEHEFSIATKEAPGANPLDLISYVRNVQNHRKEFDYLIVLVHSGISGYPLPSPRLLETCRFFAEMGADAIICQHSHCPGCYENYQSSYIVYGQGNFIFDWEPNPGDAWNKGFLIKLGVIEKGKHIIDLIPYVQSDERIGARKISPAEETSFRREIEARSAAILAPDYIYQEWSKHCANLRSSYYKLLMFGHSNNRVTRKLIAASRLAERLYSRKHLLIVQNLMQCESHREVLETILMQE